MLNANVKKIARWITFVLRHEPEQINIKLNRNINARIIDKNGYVLVKDLLEASNISLEELKEIVKSDNKMRFSFSIDKLKIRANQGHSSKLVNLELIPATPPNTLYHGTAKKFLVSIKIDGLKSMSRQHVHLSDNTVTATQVGSRHGEVVLLKIDCRKMIEDGVIFFLSENKVWLTNKVLPKYILNLND
jgi:putative RNA 2'-phosphotransferase